MNVGVHNFTGFTILTDQDAFCSSVTFTFTYREQLIYDNPTFRVNYLLKIRNFETIDETDLSISPSSWLQKLYQLM